ncbi:selenium metabolism membrane protein YedE/FdhT [Virgibacillus sp. 179-BFC.A HS]|uniref:Selenium metabolism membrane protein YedE/FdhT n=1 Tax=Tigheibacillus jepli TaxID=3035914 RepID=A0ABU5CDH2_9BACI|nr:selenium metabolism membrane protein YedE/FdhT [Virgibacillus sp. 179-BFC.A HS]MDY0404387.1 selenium metabolism membrane protein YedE/FdhT [Virgibacillus sp. 179-BFC.A HS]
MKNTFSKVFQHYWNPYTALLLAGLFSALYFGLTGTVWAVTGEFTRLGGHILQFFGVDISNWAYFEMVHMKGTTWTRPDGWIVWGMFIGALVTVLCSNNFKIRIPRQKRRYIQGLVGGIIAGFGARLALGCNLAAFFTGVPQFSIHSWIFIVATGVGTYIGAKISQTRWWKGKPKLSKGNITPTAAKQRMIQPYVGTIIAILYAALIIYFFTSGKPLLGLGALFGAIFGILIERGQICFTSAFRDLWLLRQGLMAKAIIAGMALSSVITIIVIGVYGMSAITQIAAPSTFIGGVLFGLGIVLASSCETGMMYRLMEGQVLYATVFVGNVIGATFLAYAWDHLGIYHTLVASGAKINLVATIGPLGAIIATLLMLGLAYLYVVYRERNGRMTDWKGVKTHANTDAS